MKKYKFIDYTEVDPDKIIQIFDSYEEAYAYGANIFGSEIYDRGLYAWRGADTFLRGEIIPFIAEENTGDAKSLQLEPKLAADEEPISNNSIVLESKMQPMLASDETDNVNHPAHYTQGGVECIEAIEASMSTDAYLGYLKGNILKYVWRHEQKGGIESLRKAQWYLARLIEECAAMAEE